MLTFLHCRPAITRASVAALAAACLAGCAIGGGSPAFTDVGGVIAGIAGQQTPHVPPNTSLIVTLLDDTRHDEKPDLIAEQRFERVTALPQPFSLKVASSNIVASHTYVVNARLWVANRLSFEAIQTVTANAKGLLPAISLVVAGVDRRPVQ